MVRIPEAAARLYKNVYICMRCKCKQRGDPSKFRAKKILCRKCGCKDFRPKRKEKKVAK
jgi:ribosomal protein L40E